MTGNNVPNTTQKFDKYFLFLREDGILHFEFEDDIDFTLEEAQASVTTAENYLNKKPAPCLVVYGKYNTFGHGVREFIASEAMNTVSVADALVLKSMGMKILGNVYLRINKPQRPTRLFNNEESAIKWLEQFLQK